MAGFTGIDNIVSKITVDGQFKKVIYNKITGAAAYTAGRWYDFSTLSGMPVANAYPGTTLVMQNLHNNSPGAMLIGNDVSPQTRHMLNMGMCATAATGVPGTFLLVDLLAYYPAIPLTTVGSPQTFITSNTFTADSDSGLRLTTTNDFATTTIVRFSNVGGALPTGLTAGVDYWTVRVDATHSRVATSYANAVAGSVIPWTDNGSGTNTMTVQLPRYSDGVGVQAFMVCTTGSGAGAQTINWSYTNTVPTSGRTSPVTVAATASAIPPHIYHSGIAANNYGPFLPRAAGDLGITSVQSVTLTTSATSGAAAFVLCKPIMQLPITTAFLNAERDLLFQTPSLPQIKDGACLAYLYYAGAATAASTTFVGYNDFIWG